MEQLAKNLAIWIKENNPDDPRDLPTLTFYLQVIFHIGFILLSCMLIGKITHKFGDMMTVLYTFTILRFFSGGAHLDRSFDCGLFSIAVTSILPWLHPLPLHQDFMMVCSIALILFYAPVNLDLPGNRIGLYKMVSLTIVAANFLLQSSLLATVFFVQALSLIPYRKGGEKLI